MVFTIPSRSFPAHVSAVQDRSVCPIVSYFLGLGFLDVGFWAKKWFLDDFGLWIFLDFGFWSPDLGIWGFGFVDFWFWTLGSAIVDLR